MFERKRVFIATLALVFTLSGLTTSPTALGSSEAESADTTMPDPDSLVPVSSMVADQTADQTAAKTIEITRAWSRATPPGAPMGAIYMDFRNHSLEEISIDDISTDVAELSEVHQSIEVNGVMRMREVTPFLLPKNRTVSLQPGGKHVMLMRLKQSLQAGTVFTLTVTDSLGIVHEVPVKVGGYGQMSYPK